MDETDPYDVPSSNESRIDVVERTEAHISGTFEALLTGTDPDGDEVTVPVSGTFDLPSLYRHQLRAWTSRRGAGMWNFTLVEGGN